MNPPSAGTASGGARRSAHAAAIDFFESGIDVAALRPRRAGCGLKLLSEAKRASALPLRLCLIAPRLGADGLSRKLS